jgi:hypothetical protein
LPRKTKGRAEIAFCGIRKAVIVADENTRGFYEVSKEVVISIIN